MKPKLSIAWPYLCALVALGLVVFGGSESTGALPPATSPPATSPPAMGEAERSAVAEGSALRDPVCHMDVGAGISSLLDGRSYFFCTEMCREKFEKDPARYLTELCAVCRGEGRFTPVGEGSPEAVWQKKTYRFCSEEHRKLFREDAAGYFLHSMWGIPNWLYYSSIALLLLLSFGLIELQSGRGEASISEEPEKLRRPLPPSHTARVDLLSEPWIAGFFRFKATRFFFQAVLVVLFLGIIGAGLFGNQLPSKNIAPILTWTVWWCGLVLLILYAGKAWCYVCPWDALAGWIEGLRFWGGQREGLSLGLKWPRVMRNIWPATILFIGLTWVELGFDVTSSPRATAWLALTMLGLAVGCALIFDHRAFCRYGCLIGRISGLYALFSPVEIRARDREVCKSCRTKSCYKGSEEGMACPTSQYLGKMDLNTYCVSCMECVKTCESNNVALNLRPWGEDLARHHKPRSDEAYLALLMLSLTGFHGLTMTAAWRDVTDQVAEVTGWGHSAAFTLGMLAIIVAPIGMYALLVGASRMLAGDEGVTYREYFIRYAYALLPIALFYHLAHNAEHLLMEGQKVFALISDPLGYEWNLFGTARWRLEPLVDLPTLWLVQVFLVLIGHIYSLWVARKTAGALFSGSKAARRSQIPMLVAVILFSLVSLWLLKQPMEMRTSAM